MATTTPRVNYLNNRDLLKEIHLSKNTYCSFLTPELDHRYDLILPSVSKINQKTIAEARKAQADRIKYDTGEVVNEKKILVTDLVFRVMTREHIPLAPKKKPKVLAKKKKIEDILEFEEMPLDDSLDDLVDEQGIGRGWGNLGQRHIGVDNGSRPHAVGGHLGEGDCTRRDSCGGDRVRGRNRSPKVGEDKSVGLVGHGIR